MCKPTEVLSIRDIAATMRTMLFTLRYCVIMQNSSQEELEILDRSIKAFKNISDGVFDQDTEDGIKAFVTYLHRIDE